MIKANTNLIWNGGTVSNDFDKAQFKSLSQSASLVEGQAVALAPSDLGGLRKSINTQVRKDNAAVGSNLDYAPHVEFGTRAHTINVKNASVLTNGKSFFGKTVNHPGTKAQPFLLPALVKNRNRIIEIFRKNGIALKWVSKKRGFE